MLEHIEQGDADAGDRFYGAFALGTDPANPGNIGSPRKVSEVVASAREHHIPIRIGVNAGSLEKDLLTYRGAIEISANVVPDVVENAFIYLTVLQQTKGPQTEEELFNKVLVMNGLYMTLKSESLDDLIPDTLAAAGAQRSRAARRGERRRQRVEIDELDILKRRVGEFLMTRNELLVDGEPVPWALARIPGAGDFRGNLAKGGTGKGVPLSERDRWICGQVAPELKRRGILFAGLDVIGDYLTEINVTSPTCIREIDAGYDLDIAGQLMDCIEEHLAARG